MFRPALPFVFVCAGAWTTCVLVTPAGAQLKAPPPAQPKPESSTALPAGTTDRSDRITARRQRDGALEVLSGVVTANTLGQVVFQQAGKEIKLDSELVEQINWGLVPASFQDGRVFFERRQFGNAAAQFRLCASDVSARSVVRAAARLWAAEALLRWGASDPLHFVEAGDEAGKLLADFPTSREVPEARSLQARAKWMAGDAAEAARLYKSIYAEWKASGPTAGYRRELCFEAGLSAARAACQARPPDSAGAKQIYGSLEAATRAALAALEPNSPARPRLERLKDEASMGEGFAELSAGKAQEALSLFEGHASRASGASDTLRCAAGFGMAQAHRALGKLREAQIEFARVAALEHSDRDRVAAAQIGLAETTLELADPDSIPRARTLAEAVARTHGDTLAALRARELLAKL